MKLFFLPILLFAATSFSFAQFSYAPINVPGAVATEARGVNNNGEIVGFYKTTACTDSDIKVPNCTTKGFKYVNGTFVKLMVPNSVSTAILGVNDLGDLVGFYKKSDGSVHGFIWFHTNTVKTIDYPNPPSGTKTIPFGINKAGTVVGGLWSVSSGGTFPAGGWVWSAGNFSNMNPAQSNAVAPCCWSVNGITNTGLIAGQVFQSDFNMAWFKQATDEDFFMNVPAGNTGADTFATGLNARADIIGYSAQGSLGWFAVQIEQNEGAESSEATPHFVTVKFPNSGFTIPFGVNYARAVVGVYTDSSGKQHGFMAKANF